MTAPIELSAGRLLLDGKPSVVLCSSVFPFRIPSSQWDHRLALVQESGYGMVDLYVHWGFHEQRPGEIDFASPERDLRRFLELAAARDLLVMARPGPYICSETDGGGLPWWLHGDAEGAPAALRTTDADYLAAVDRRFGAVMPILAAAQVTRGGPVALVQIENELDFFDCPDPAAYMTHLVEAARAHGIEVPVIACAGQGDLAGATGDAPGVVPTVNLYPDDTAASFDEESRHYAEVLAGRDLPLMVTETNRLHRTLRREILAGARLVAPYLQTSGFDHLVLPSAGNWGDPGNLMTHDYDFGGYLSPDGRRRPEYDEAVALSATLAAWGERLATARPRPLPADGIDGIRTGGALALDGGGTVVGPAELTGLDVPVRLRPAGSPAVEAVVAAGTCPFWALDVPLGPWGAQGTLEVATAELVGVAADGDALVLTFEGGPGALVSLSLEAADGGTETLRRVGPGESRSRGASDPVRIVLRERGAGLADPEPALRAAAADLLPVGDALEQAGLAHQVAPGLRGAEALGLADGRLSAEFEISAAAQEVLLLGAADLVRLMLDGTDHGVHVAHGAPLSLALAPGSPHRLRVDVEIWGRANFDDARRPALRLGAGRGAGTVLEVRGVEDVTDLWEVRTLPDRRADGPLTSPPLRGLGGWSSANPGADTVYARSLSLPGGEERAVLRLRGLTHPVHVTVRGGEQEGAGERDVTERGGARPGASEPDAAELDVIEQLVVPDTPVVLLPEGAGEVEVRVRAPHVPGGLLEGAELLTAAAPRLRDLRTTPAEELAARLDALAAAAAPERWRRADGSVRLAAGSPLLLRLDPTPAGPGRAPAAPGQDPTGLGQDGREAGQDGPEVGQDGPEVGQDGPEVGQLGPVGEQLVLAGQDVQVTVVSGGRRVSRHVLGDPAVSGGDAARAWIPAPWRAEAGGPTLLLLEALSSRGGIFRGAKRATTDR
jgi:hypothetical protein